ncbi:hypothetical protein QMK19_38840 [Streptomyces sp. H10-C2]|uniref:hypothetical protein n=1 Tax=unclassified Streptomyces TaxID=2593676 RepID=UPI0024BAEDC3|nr:MULTISPECIES: hypothetical protein [unclassified Streptomyces]MDJ0347181.1 hypothetical protein [Streptomyces sp. PH10-H1]MDJ0375392.1 hypothetical protein [Streptomyces sp. H10-C2]
MPESAPVQWPFRVGFDMETREVIVWMTFGAGPKQTTRRMTITSLEALAVAVAEHRHEAFLQRGLADQLVRAGVTYLGADPTRLEAAVKALSDPTSAVPVSRVLRGGVPPQTPS